MSIDSGLKDYGWNSARSTPDHAYTLPAIIKLLPVGGGYTSWMQVVVMGRSLENWPIGGTQ